MKEIKLTTPGKVALVDDQDFDELNKFSWHVRRGYVVRTKNIDKKKIAFFMHREIMNTPAGMDTDHKDHNGLNNQRSNLRVCTRLQNMHNRKKQSNGITSKFKGVYLHTRPKYKYYIAYLWVARKCFSKSFPYTPEGEIQAAKHYNELALEHHKEFALLNVII